MKIEFRDGAICIVAESVEDNCQLRSLGADPDRAMISISIEKDAAEPQSLDMYFEPLVISLSRADVRDSLSELAPTE